jgi:hypothetical protein
MAEWRNDDVHRLFSFFIPPFVHSAIHHSLIPYQPLALANPTTTSAAPSKPSSPVLRIA